jgi:hypothetical protein
MNLVNDMFNATGSNENGASSANNIASVNNENDEHTGTIGLSSISNSQVVNL